VFEADLYFFSPLYLSRERPSCLTTLLEKEGQTFHIGFHFQCMPSFPRISLQLEEDYLKMGILEQRECFNGEGKLLSLSLLLHECKKGSCFLPYSQRKTAWFPSSAPGLPVLPRPSCAASGPGRWIWKDTKGTRRETSGRTGAGSC